MVAYGTTSGEKKPIRMASIIFTGGGTGGHVYPGLAVYAAVPAELRQQVVWIGSLRGMERSIVAGSDIPYRGVPAGKLRRYLDPENILDVARVLAGIVAAWRLLGHLKARVVFSKGGFVAVPVVVAAWLRRIPVVIHESDADPGLATRLTAPLARRIFVAYPDTLRTIGARLRQRARVSGNPVRRAFLEPEARGDAGLPGIADDGRPLLLVTGGSLGARQLNELIVETIAQLGERALVVHQCGEHGREAARRAAARAPEGSYLARPRFDAEFPALLRRAEVVVARAGAGTIWEIAVCRTPAILVPLSTGASRGDQIRNARRFAAATGALVLEDPALDAAAFRAAVLGLLDDSARRIKMRSAMAGWAATDAAEVIAAELALRARMKYHASGEHGYRRD